MRGIRVIAKKVAKVGIMNYNDKIFINYINNLTSEAQNFKGFQNTNRYWEKNYNQLIAFSISDWESENDWNNWLESNTRKLIRDKHQEVILEEKFNILLKSKNKDNTFLL